MEGLPAEVGEHLPWKGPRCIKLSFTFVPFLKLPRASVGWPLHKQHVHCPRKDHGTSLGDQSGATLPISPAEREGIVPSPSLLSLSLSTHIHVHTHTYIKILWEPLVLFTIYSQLWERTFLVPHGRWVIGLALANEFHEKSDVSLLGCTFLVGMKPPEFLSPLHVINVAAPSPESMNDHHEQTPPHPITYSGHSISKSCLAVLSPAEEGCFLMLHKQPSLASRQF